MHNAYWEQQLQSGKTYKGVYLFIINEKKWKETFKLEI